MNTAYVKALPPHWEKYSRVYSALGDPQRQKILLLFEAGERLSIKQIVDVFPMSRTALVHHIQVLVDAGVLRRTKSGKEVLLRIDKKRLASTIRAVADFIEEHA